MLHEKVVIIAGWKQCGEFVVSYFVKNSVLNLEGLMKIASMLTLNLPNRHRMLPKVHKRGKRRRELTVFM